jgi:hypothetical protein
MEARIAIFGESDESLFQLEFINRVEFLIANETTYSG